MAARRRVAAKRGWPPNLYEKDGYFSWRDPMTGRTYGLGRDRQAAFAEAIEANLHIAGLLQQPRLIDRLTGDAENTLDAWCNRYERILEDRQQAKATRDAYRQRINMVREGLGANVVSRVTTRMIADFLAPWNDAGKRRMAQAMRSLLLDLFREAIAAGWTDTNPVQPTRANRVAVKRARLTLDAFLAIYEAAGKMPAWVRRSMELALVTGQRREDVAALGPRDVRQGKLWVVQQKTNAHVCIPLSLRLDALGWTVGDIIGRCRDSVVSRHLIHHTAHVGQAKPGNALRLATITAAFTAVRDTCGIAWPDDKTPPTFHEIRSLSARLYADQYGAEFAQALLGHKSADMTAIYRDVRGAEWIEIKTA